MTSVWVAKTGVADDFHSIRVRPAVFEPRCHAFDNIAVDSSRVNVTAYATHSVITYSSRSYGVK